MPGPTEDHRFGFLFNPIKDLAKNWQVDLSKFLGDYLSELTRTNITLDGGETVMNFAEAAMLIQGSACVYGRKVEFLWQMVLQMLQLLANKKEAAKNGSRARKGMVDPNETLGFLPMDDMPLCKKHVKESTVTKSMLKLLPVTPVSLVDKDKTMKAVPLLAISGELLGNKDDYRLNSTMCSVTGMLCTEMDTAAIQHGVGRATFAPILSPDVSVALATSGVSDADVGDPMEDDGGGGGGDCPASPEPSTPLQPEPEPEKRTQQRQLRRRREIATAPAPANTQPWKPKDLYEESGQKRRPIRKGRITLRPPCLCQQRAGKRKRKLAEVEPAVEPVSVYAAGEPAPPPTISDYLKLELLDPARRLTRSQLRHVRPQLRRDLMRELERRKAELQHLKLKTREVSCDEKDPALLAAADTSDCDSLADADLPDADGGDFPHPDDHRVNMPTAPPPPPDTAAAADQPTAGSYEERVQRRVAEYLSTAQEYMQSTEMSRRVARWQEAVLPRLQAEQQRKEFNIHDYGSRILQWFPEGGGKNTLPFSEVVRDEPAPEVARYLLSSLMLANTYNVEITDPCDPYDGMDAMELTILSRRRHHEQLDHYHAPSQQSPTRKTSEEAGRVAGTTRSSPRKPAHQKKRAPTRAGRTSKPT